jgi:hypothetical protein
MTLYTAKIEKGYTKLSVLCFFFKSFLQKKQNQITKY